MELYTINHGFRYELENICRLFFPFEKITVKQEFTEPSEAFYALTSVEIHNGEATLFAEVKTDAVCRTQQETLNCADGFDDECERVLAVLLYKIFCELTDSRPQWGILTGVRPGKLMRKMVAELGTDGAKAYFKDKLLCSDNKIELCLEAFENEEKIIASSRPDNFSLYLSVPFCPTRCSYCSFVSHSVEKSMKLVDEYVELLCEELRYTGKLVRSLGLSLSTIYVGGGTPTTLSAVQLERVMNTVAESFDIPQGVEYTVEAGRPDTVDAHKLNAIKRGGANRISINPQTMNDDVLKVIGRRHTAKQTLEAFKLARDCGFDNINMDLIAGLPTDTLESFSSTLEQVLGLEPESVTVHTLSLKRSSTMTVSGNQPQSDMGKIADGMLNRSVSRLTSSGYAPYYLYRQSKTVGNLENTGYAKKGYESKYNIFIMDETHSIIACGPSAVTKLRAANGHIERVFNYKYPYEYISRFDEILRRKDAISDFYRRFGIKG